MSLTEALASERATGPAASQPGFAVPGYESFPVIERRWYWPGYVPIGAPVVLAAKGGTGKGFLTAAMAARVVLGLPFPGEDQEERREPARVLWITGPGEDDPYEDLAPRLRAAIAHAVREFGLDPELSGEGERGAIRLIHNLSRWKDGGLVTVPADCNRILAVIAKMNRQAEEQGSPAVGMVVADSLSALLSVGSSIDYRQRARQVMVDLAEFARAADIAFVILHHFTKDGKVAGSPAVLDSLRVVLRVDRSAEDDRVRVITQEKANASDAEPQRYVITGEGLAAHAEFADVREDRAPRVVAAEKRAVPPLVRPRMAPALPSGAVAATRPDSGDDGPFTVLCLVRRDKCPEAHRALPGKYRTRAEAYAAVVMDSGAVLRWRDAPGMPGVHVAAYSHPDGSERVYGVKPESSPN